MTRQEAMNILIDNKRSLGSNRTNMILAELDNGEYVKAASLLIDHYNFYGDKLCLALADAIWEGKK